MSESCVSKPHPHDVLSGRGKNIHGHEGNVFYRDLIQKYKVQYVVASLRKDKHAFAEFIYDAVLARGGRFLKELQKTGMWFPIDKKEAIRKVKAALRDGAPNIEKLLKEETSRQQEEEVERCMKNSFDEPLMSNAQHVSNDRFGNSSSYGTEIDISLQDHYISHTTEMNRLQEIVPINSVQHEAQIEDLKGMTNSSNNLYGSSYPSQASLSRSLGSRYDFSNSSSSSLHRADQYEHVKTGECDQKLLCTSTSPTSSGKSNKATAAGGRSENSSNSSFSMICSTSNIAAMNMMDQLDFSSKGGSSKSSILSSFMSGNESEILSDLDLRSIFSTDSLTLCPAA